MSNEEAQQTVDEAVKRLMDARVGAQSEELSGRLAAARRDALEGERQHGNPLRHTVTRWGISVALAASLFVAVGVQFFPGQLNNAGVGGVMTGEPELAVAEVDVEFLQDLDFYYWYGEEVGTGL